MNSCPPYRPLRGAEPPHFVDRPDDDLGTTGICAASVSAYLRGPSDPRFHRLVVSAPALGKTALLRAVGRQVAVHLDWAVTFHRCRPKQRAVGAVTAEIVASMQGQWPALGSALASEVPGPRPDEARPGRRGEHPAGRALAPVAGFTAPPGPDTSWAELRHVLQVAGRFAARRGRGLLVIFDDADVLGGGEVESLGHLARALARDDLPVALLMSGGPLLAARFARVGHFSGAVWPTHLDWFDDAEVREALVVPAADRDVDFQDEALELLCLAAGGSPLEVQRLGFAAWSAAPGGHTVPVAAVEEAIGMARPELAARAS
jgi:hypothetical protein